MKARCIMRAALYFACYGEIMCQVLFSNMTHQVKAIAIAIVEANNPLVKIVSVFLISSLYTYRICIHANYIIKRGVHPYSASIYLLHSVFIVVSGSDRNTKVLF